MVATYNFGSVYIRCKIPEPIAQSVASPNADPGIASSITTRSHTFVDSS